MAINNPSESMNPETEPPAEVYNLLEIPENVVEEVRQFVRDEMVNTDLFERDVDKDDPRIKERRQANMVLSVYGSGAIGKSMGQKDGNVLIVRDDNNKIEGLGVIIIDATQPEPDMVTSLFFGRAWDANGKGIGLKILRKQHEILKERGIKTYTVGVGDNSRKVYAASDAEIQEMEKTESGNSRLLVKVS